MNDTLAAAASGAGGMNSYAMAAAQQANNYYMAQLGDKIPELQQIAYQMYLDDYNMGMQNIGMVQGLDNTQYNRYRDSLGDWYSDRDFSYGAYRDSVGDWQWLKNFDYNAGRDAIADERYENEWEYGVGRDEVADGRYENEVAYERAMSLLNAGVMPDEETLAAAGISAEQAQRILAALGFGGGSTGGGNTGGYDYTNGGMTQEEIRAIQEELGVTVDGLWGPETQRAWEAKYGDGTPDDDPLGGLFDDDEEEEPVAEPTVFEGEDETRVVNRHGADWIHIPGKGRMTYQEVMSYVESGKIKEVLTPDGWEYTWVG